MLKIPLSIIISYSYHLHLDSEFVSSTQVLRWKLYIYIYIYISLFPMYAASSIISLYFTVAITSALSSVVTISTVVITGYPRVQSFCAFKAGVLWDITQVTASSMWCWIETTRTLPISSLLFPATFAHLDEPLHFALKRNPQVLASTRTAKCRTHSKPLIYKKIKSSVCFSYSGYQVRGQVYPVTCNEGQEGEQRQSFTLSLSSALHKDGSSTPSPRPLYRKEKRPSTHGTGGSQRRFLRVQKVSLSPELEPRTLQTEASRYTDWVTPARSLSARRRKISHSGMGGGNHSANFICIKFIANAILMCYGLPNWTQHSHEQHPIIVHCFVKRSIMPWRNIAWTA